jgi:hypothetical protein
VATLLTPSNGSSLQTRQPRFSWSQSNPAATYFRLYITRNASAYMDQWMAGTTSWTPTFGLPGGTYTWWVHPWNEVGYGPWSAGSGFTIQTAVPGALTLVSPSGNGAPGSTQRYTWRADTAATWYELYVLRNGSAVGDKWYTLTDSVLASTTGNFVVDLSGHTSGNYQWWVRGWGPDGLGLWSGSLTFPVP